jgi:acyl carrier protein
VSLQRLPVTHNGKLDMAALPDPDEVAAGVEPGRAPLDGATETALADIWSHLLGIDAIGPQDDFFDLGGNSIKATQMVSRIRRTWGVELSLRLVLRARTVRQCAALIERTLAEQIEMMPEEDARRLVASLATGRPTTKETS